MKLAGSNRAIASHPSRVGLTRPSAAGPVWTGEVRFNRQWLRQPLRWRRPRRVFVAAHSDLFHDAVHDDVIDQLFAVMGEASQHQFQVLTKRPERMRAYLAARKGAAPIMVPLGDGTLAQHPFNSQLQPPPNVWLGVSVEDQTRANQRIPLLLDTPAAVRWLSCEPLLGPVDLEHVDALPDPHGDPAIDWKFNALLAGGSYEALDSLGKWFDADGPDRPAIDWVVAGGESGPGSRPMQAAWARSLRDQCAAADVAFLFKQWGDWWPLDQAEREWGLGRQECRDLFLCATTDDHACTGKRKAGRLLDGQQHDGFPA